VHAQATVDASTAHADEDTSVDGGPAGTGGAPAPHTVCTLLVVWQVQQLLQGCQLLLVLLHGHPFHLTCVPVSTIGMLDQS
jgi:hypothetical protein